VSDGWTVLSCTYLFYILIAPLYFVSLNCDFAGMLKLEYHVNQIPVAADRVLSCTNQINKLLIFQRIWRRHEGKAGNNVVSSTKRLAAEAAIQLQPKSKMQAGRPAFPSTARPFIRNEIVPNYATCTVNCMYATHKFKRWHLVGAFPILLDSGAGIRMTKRTAGMLGEYSAVWGKLSGTWISVSSRASSSR
jgi:hypothetical protein